MPKSTPSSPTAAADSGAPVCAPTTECPLKKSIAGIFAEAKAKCGDSAHVQADGVNISEAASTRFGIVRQRDKGHLTSVSGPMTGQTLRNLDWKPKRPADWASGDVFVFDVTADGVSATSGNTFAFHEYPNAGPETKTFKCKSGVFGWTGKFDIATVGEQVVVTVKIKLINRQGPKPASASDPKPAAGDPVSAEDKAAMKADVEGKISEKVKLTRKNCGFGDACSCGKPVKIVVSFVESGEHHVVDLYTGPGRANATNWTRVKTRDNSWAHETGHLLGWYDEYTGGAVGAAPRWKPNEAANIMNVGLTMPPEYAWDFRDWHATKTGEDWKAK